MDLGTVNINTSGAAEIKASEVREAIAANVIKKSQSQAKNLVETLIVSQQPVVTPKGMHSTFEKIA